MAGNKPKRDPEGGDCGVNGCKRKTGGTPCWQHSVPVETRVPEVRTQDKPTSLRGLTHWPDGLSFPGAYRKPHPLPCPSCRRLRLDDMAQAVICVNSGLDDGDVAYFRCKACSHRFKLPVVRRL